MDGYKNVGVGEYKDPIPKQSEQRIITPPKVNRVVAKEEQPKPPEIKVKLGDSVQHKYGNIGKVISLDEKYIKIEFDDKQSTFQFPKAFIDGFLKTV